MKVVIIGAGDTGSFISRYMIEEGYDVVVVDMDATKIRNISDNESVAGIVGDATSIETFDMVDIKSADLFIATTNNDEINMISCQLAAFYGVKYKICKLKEPKYSKEEWQEIFRIGVLPLDDIISTGTGVIKSLTKQIKYNHLNISDILEFSGDSVKVFAVFCTEDSIAINKTISSLYQENISSSIHFRILGIQRDNIFNLAQNDDIIKENDKIFVITEDNHIESIYMLFFSIEESENQFIENQSPNIIISGDHPFIKLLAIDLAQYYNRIKVIVDNKNMNVDALAMELEQYNCQVIIDDITKVEYRNNYLKSQDDILIVMNKEDDTNILKSLQLKHQKVGNIFCILNNTEHENLLLSYKINHIVVPLYFIMSPILSYIRRGIIMNAYTLYNKAEILEIEIDENSGLVGLRVAELEEDGKMIVGMIFNDETSIHITGDTIINIGYKVIIVGLRKHMREVEDRFSHNAYL